MNALEIRLIAYGLLACGLISFAAYCTHRLDSVQYERLQAQFSDYRTQVATDNGAAQKALSDALKAQMDQRNLTETRNAQLQTSLQTAQADAAAARTDADFAHRLLAAAQNARAAAGGAAVSKAQGGRGSDGATSASGNGSVADLAGDVAAAAAEARECFQKYTALQLELSPQL